MSIATEESFYILKYNPEAVEKAKDNTDAVTEDGIEEAFDVSCRSVLEVEVVVIISLSSLSPSDLSNFLSFLLCMLGTSSDPLTIFCKT